MLGNHVMIACFRDKAERFTLGLDSILYLS